MASSALLLFEAITGGDLAPRLAEWRRAGRSYENIARELSRYPGGASVSGETVRRWCRDLELSEAAS